MCRGLDTRCALARARSRMIADPEDGNDEWIEVLLQAQADGYHDFHAGFLTVPTMFADEPELAGWWVDGQEKAQKDDAFERDMHADIV